MRKQDAWGQPILKVGDIVRSNFQSGLRWPPRAAGDPGTVTRVIQSNANGAYVVAVKWFVWNDSATSEEYVSDLKIVSEV